MTIEAERDRAAAYTTTMSDRLSELPDDLLRRILHFAPLKEAASTTALSRRWSAPPLWLSSAALNLETGVQYNAYRDEPEDAARFRFFSERDAFVSEALAALDAADAPVTRLTLHIKSPCDDAAVADFLSRDDKNDDGVVVSLVDVLLSHRAARRIQELRLVFTGCRDYVDYKVAMDALPLETLRVLDLTDCKGLDHCSQATAFVLPGLSSLRLSHCSQHLGCLQRVIDSAPALAAIHLKNVFIYATPPPWHLRLRCPAATVLVLDRCRWTADGVEIDAPRLRRFRYKGLFGSLLLTPQPMELESVDLSYINYLNKDLDLDSATFWQLARSFTSTKEMRLSVKHIEDVAVLTEASRVQLLPAFRRLKRLEVHGSYWTKKGDAAAVTIVNLLRSCPVLTALRINLVAENQATDAAGKKGIRSQIIPQKITQIPALVPYQSLRCLKSSLTAVGLQFWKDESNSFGLKANRILRRECHGS